MPQGDLLGMPTLLPGSLVIWNFAFSLQMVLGLTLNNTLVLQNTILKLPYRNKLSRQICYADFWSRQVTTLTGLMLTDCRLIVTSWGYMKFNTRVNNNSKKSKASQNWLRKSLVISGRTRRAVVSPNSDSSRVHPVQPVAFIESGGAAVSEH